MDIRIDVQLYFYRVVFLELHLFAMMRLTVKIFCSIYWILDFYNYL